MKILLRDMLIQCVPNWSLLVKLPVGVSAKIKTPTRSHFCSSSNNREFRVDLSCFLSGKCPGWCQFGLGQRNVWQSELQGFSFSYIRSLLLCCSRLLRRKRHGNSAGRYCLYSPHHFYEARHHKTPQHDISSATYRSQYFSLSWQDAICCLRTSLLLNTFHDLHWY